MKKRSKFLAMLLSTAVAVSSLTGISVFAADKTSGEEETRTVVDATGAEVEVPAHPKRIAVPAMVLPNMVYVMHYREMQRIWYLFHRQHIQDGKCLF